MTGPMDMIDDEDRVFAELDRLLNDPEVPMPGGARLGVAGQGGRAVRRVGFRLGGVVGARGFEPPASCSQSRRTTRLYYTPDLAGVCDLRQPGASELA